MKIIHKTYGYANYSVIAEISDEEALLSEAVLVMMVDGHTRESAQKTYDEGGHPGHFGYREFRREKYPVGWRLFVTVYID